MITNYGSSEELARKYFPKLQFSQESSINRKKYDPNRIPPDWDMAVNHGLATRFSKPIDPERFSFIEIDDMSGLPILNEQLPLLCDFEKLSFLPPGYAMFFQFRNFTLRVLLLIFFVGGLYNLYTNYYGDFCIETLNKLVLSEYMDSEICLKNFSNSLSLQNKMSNATAIYNQQLLNLLTVIILMLYYQKFRLAQRRLAVKVGEQRITPADYTFSVSNIPTGHVNGLPNNRQLEIRRIVLTYNVSERITIERKIDKLARKKIQDEKRRQNGLSPLMNSDHLDEHIRECERKLRLISQNFATGASKSFTGTAFITVNTQIELDEVLEHWHLPNWRRITEPFETDSRWKFKEKVLIVEEADEPNDVFWENQGTSQISLFLRRSIVFLGTVCVLLIFFWIILVVSLERRRAFVEAFNTKNWIRVITISAFASILVLVLNYILRRIMMLFTKFQNYSSWTKYDISLSTKICWVQFFNTALTSFTIAVVFDNFWGQGGLITSIHQLFFANAVLSAITQFCDFAYFWLKLRRYSALSRGVDSFKTQKQDYPFDFAFRYGGMLKNIYTAAFYAPLFPLGVFWTLICCFFDMLADRISNLVFDYILFGEVSGPAIACCVITLVNLYLPTAYINEYLFGRIRPKFSEVTYDEIKADFDLDYDQANPATRHSEAAHRKKMN